MRIIIDAAPLDLYPVGKEGFHGGSELYVHKLAEGLARTHLVHVVTADLETEQQRGERLFYWPKAYHPTAADAVVMVHNLENIEPYSADFLILASNGIGAYLGPDDAFTSGIDAVACFSQCHIDLLTRHHKGIDRATCHVTGLGVDLAEFDEVTYSTDDPLKVVSRRQMEKVPGRMLYANDPQRGLLDTLKVFDCVRNVIPDATLHVAYDFARVFTALRWNAHAMSEQLWECKERIDRGDGVTNLGALTRAQVIDEMIACQVHAYPSNPPNVGSQIHGLSQLECAAAGTPLVLSDVEAFPEVFGEAAEILPVPGAFLPEAERRCDHQDWADVVVELMRDKETWQKASEAARRLAERHTWDAVIARWETMLAGLAAGRGQRVAETV